MDKTNYYPTKADINIKDVNLSSNEGSSLSEIIGLWQFTNWDEKLKVLQILREARKRDYDSRQEAKKKRIEGNTEEFLY